MRARSGIAAWLPHCRSAQVALPTRILSHALAAAFKELALGRGGGAGRQRPGVGIMLKCARSDLICVSRVGVALERAGKVLLLIWDGVKSIPGPAGMTVTDSMPCHKCPDGPGDDSTDQLSFGWEGPDGWSWPRLAILQDLVKSSRMGVGNTPCGLWDRSCAAVGGRCTRVSDCPGARLDLANPACGPWVRRQRTPAFRREEERY